jgi:hypothetical protein
MDHTTRLDGTRVVLSIDAGPSFIPFIGPQGGTWRYRLNPEVPTALSIHTGVSHLEVDLSDLRVTDFSFDGGASNLELTLPARVPNGRAKLQAGAANLQIRVPEGVAIRLRAKGVGSTSIDQARFPRREPGLYQSADYDSAAYRSDVIVDGAATSIRVY